MINFFKNLYYSFFSKTKNKLRYVFPKPSTLKEAIDILVCKKYRGLLWNSFGLSRKIAKELNEDRFSVKFHHTLGRFLRNYWELWGNSKLKNYFNSMEIFHPDDMTDIILTCLYREFNNKPWNVKEQVKLYNDN